MNLKERIENYQPQMIEALKELVKFKSVRGGAKLGAPYGEENAKCLERALEIAGELGFKTHNMDGHVGWAEYGEGDEMIGIAAHLDVVAGGDGWTVCEPFEPVIKDGKMFGRGTMDNKGPAVIALYALKALIEEGFLPKRRIRILFGCDEENGSCCMKYYCANGGEIPVAGFTPDASFPLIQGEKGHMKLTVAKTFTQSEGWKLLNIQGGAASNVVPQHAKAELEVSADAKDYLKEEKNILVQLEGTHLVVEAAGVSAHASRPEHGENAIGRLCLYLQKLPLSKEAKEAISYLADKLGMDSTGAGFGINFSDEPSGPVTLNLGMISSVAKDGEVKVQAVLDSRCPVTYGYEDLVPLVKDAFVSAGWNVEEESWSDSIYQPDDSEIVQKLLGVYRKVTGDMTPGYCIGGGTYAKDLPNILAFGAEKQGADHCIHGADEYIILEQMKESALIYAEAMKALAE